jgi:hypothetical protein
LDIIGKNSNINIYGRLAYVVSRLRLREVAEKAIAEGGGFA